MVTTKTTTAKKPTQPKKPNVNYTQLKILFYKYEGPLQAFLREHKIRFTTSVETKTKTWVKDRKAFIANIEKQAEEKTVQGLAEKQAVILGNLQTAKIAWLQELAERLSKPKTLKVATIRSIINEIRLELGEATEITKNEGAVTSLKQKALDLLRDNQEGKAQKS